MSLCPDFPALQIDCVLTGGIRCHEAECYDILLGIFFLDGSCLKQRLARFY